MSETLMAKNEPRAFEPCPAGLHAAVCCDVIDRGLMPTQWGDKHKVQIRWQVSETGKNGQRFVVSKLYTLSLHPKSVLRADLESWRGRAFPAAGPVEFDLTKLLGVNCQINVVQAQKGDAVYANVKGVVPIGRGQKQIQVEGYQRVRDRVAGQAEVPPPDDTDGASAADAEAGEEGGGDDALPF